MFVGKAGAYQYVASYGSLYSLANRYPTKVNVTHKNHSSLLQHVF
jgi:hypothetical protein